MASYRLAIATPLTKAVDAVPLTRDYMARWEQAHVPAEEASSRRLKSVS